MELDLTNKSVQNVLLRQKAKELWRANRKTLFLLLIVTFGIVYGLSGLTSLLGEPQAAEIIAADGSLHVRYETTSPLALAAGWAVGLLTAPLMLGYLASLLDHARGVHATPVSGLFRRINVFLKAIELNLLIYLKVFLWVLPGMAVMLEAAFLPNWGVSQEVMAFMMLCGIILMFVLAIPAAMRYALATWFLTDCPERGVRSSIALSKQKTKGRKWQLFKLALPNVFKLLGMVYVTLLADLAIAALLVALDLQDKAIGQTIMSIVPAATIFVAGAPFLSQIGLSMALFFVKYANDADAKQTDEAPVDEVPAE